MREEILYPTKRAQEIMVAWFTFQRMIRFDPVINKMYDKMYDPDRLLEQCGHVIAEMGAGLHNFPEIVSGRFDHEDSPAEYKDLVAFLKEECDWIYQRLKTLQVPEYLLEPQFHNNTLNCWTHFCDLIAETIDAHPIYGEITSCEMPVWAYRESVIKMARACGGIIRPRFRFFRLYDSNKITIEFPNDNDAQPL